MEHEIWKPVVGWEKDYEVSSYGRIRSRDRSVGMRTYGKETHKTVKGRMMTPQYDKDGYFVVHLRDTFNGRNKLLKLHRLVAEAFIPNPDSYPQIDHIDGNRDNNFVENLRWCTNKQNSSFPLACKNRSEAIKASYERHPELRSLRGKTWRKVEIDVWHNGLYVKRFPSMASFCKYSGLTPEKVSVMANTGVNFNGYIISKVEPK